MENQNFKKLITIELEEYLELLELNKKILNGEVFHTVTYDFGLHDKNLIKRYISSDIAFKNFQDEINLLIYTNKNLKDDNYELKKTVIKLNNENSNLNERVKKMEQKLNLINLMNLENKEKLEKFSKPKNKLFFWLNILINGKK